MKLLRTTLLALACALPVLSYAQWLWIDKSGHKVFSDRSPPADIPTKNILKQPGGKGSTAIAEPTNGASVAAATAAATANAPKINRTDKDLEAKKKQAEMAEAEKAKVEQEQVAKAKAENCNRAKLAKVNLESGVRIKKTNDKGEREFMDDATRATEVKRLQGIMDADCKS
jgi:cytoskeletal protein RodZ